MPRLSAASATRRMASIPALWPMTRGSRRSRAQRLLPSMMIATCSGGGNWLTWGSWALDLHDFGFFARRHLVDQANVPVRELLQLLTAAVRFVGRNLFLLFERLDAVHLLPTNVANRDVRPLRVALHEPRIFAPPLLIQRRDGDPDQRAVVAGVQRRGISVVLDGELVHQGWAGSSRPDRQDLFAKGLQALLHFGFRVLDVGFDHSGAPTIVPICLPAMTPSR